MTEEHPEDSAEQLFCAGCRQEGTRRDLERFVYHDSVGLLFDMRGGAPGDSVWVHPLPGCVRPACWAGFDRALDGRVGGLDAGELLDDLRAGIQRRLTERLTEAARHGQVVAGRENVEDAGAAGELELVLAVPDAAVKSFVEREELNVLSEVADAVLETAFGRHIEVAGLPSGARTRSIGRDVEKLICLEEDDGSVKRG